MLDYERQKARLTYEKFQLITKRKPYEEVNRKLATLEKNGCFADPLDASRAKELIRNSKDINNLGNVVRYLRSQRIYDELLGRYNPGLSMSQGENVQKTANMVGLQVPENK
ncbi:hypothetical protein CXQ85_004418 [Candidozyma haemuli]|uniref:Uncharacterized protein n=1 Tax=Candidozyma haemuli TaxID=45357 RepID=A0A2V1ATR3_9ASCO|nr:hypothetical protein CXQ85_004418 [[Candida] haemuloni]PVH20906.1 hypothetical protein CXQ85_004418 [[Candida] haemuloni]